MGHETTLDAFDWTRPIDVTLDQFLDALRHATQNTTNPFELVGSDSNGMTMHSPQGVLCELAGVPKDDDGFLTPMRRPNILRAALPQWLSFEQRNQVNWRHVRGDDFADIADWLLRSNSAK